MRQEEWGWGGTLGRVEVLEGRTALPGEPCSHKPPFCSPAVPPQWHRPFWRGRSSSWVRRLPQGVTLPTLHLLKACYSSLSSPGICQLLLPFLLSLPEHEGLSTPLLPLPASHPTGSTRLLKEKLNQWIPTAQEPRASSFLRPCMTYPVMCSPSAHACAHTQTWTHTETHTQTQRHTDRWTDTSLPPQHSSFTPEVSHGPDMPSLPPVPCTMPPHLLPHPLSFLSQLLSPS